MENMSRVCQQQEISHMSAFMAPEKSVFASMNDDQNRTFAHFQTCLIRLEM